MVAALVQKLLEDWCRDFLCLRSRFLTFFCGFLEIFGIVTFVLIGCLWAVAAHLRCVNNFLVVRTSLACFCILRPVFLRFLFFLVIVTLYESVFGIVWWQGLVYYSTMINFVAVQCFWLFLPGSCSFCCHLGELASLHIVPHHLVLFHYLDMQQFGHVLVKLGLTTYWDVGVIWRTIHCISSAERDVRVFVLRFHWSS